MKVKKLILVKLGGSVITDKSKEYTAREEVITRLAGEIKEAQSALAEDIRVVLGHGAGSFAHTPASKYGIAQGLNGQNLIGLPIVADVAIALNRIVIKKFLEVGLPSMSFAPASMILAKGGKMVEMYDQSLREAINIGVLPVLYGDVIIDTQQGCCIFSTEKILDLLAAKWSPDYEEIKIIMAGDTDGVYDARGQTVERVSADNFDEVKKSITGSANVDVTGGMIHKVEEALNLAQSKQITTTIINGGRKGELKKALLSEGVSGTVVA